MTNSYSLPVLAYEAEIKASVAKNDITIIKAETGAGKSTQIPQMLYEAGYNVVVTEPRRLAARTLAERVAEEMEVELGGLVGFQTGFDKMCSNDTEILFCTDGLQLVRELFGEYHGIKPQVLVIDEVHEWNINIETLIAWVKKNLQAGWKTKVVIMSATFETAELEEYYAGYVNSLDIPGRTFPVTMHESEEPIINIIFKFIKENKNCLVFVAGKKEINDLIYNLNTVFDPDSMAVVLPLHGELDSIEQKKCFKNYAVPKIIVSTNIAQTSVTIDDIDVVIDSGEERRIEIQSGIEGLFLQPVSQMDCLQRKGRAGRTRKGDYVLCSDFPFEEREKYTKAEIQRSILDQVVLRLAAIHIDAETLEFFHQPDKTELRIAKASLVNLGALKDNAITEDGRRMAKMPLACNFSRMIIEAERLNVVDDVLIITAILEIGSLIDFKNKKEYFTHTDETESDLLAELDVWKKFEGNRDIDFKKEGISAKSFFKIKELLNKLENVMEGLVKMGSTGNRKDILQACITGMVGHLYYNNYNLTNGVDLRIPDRKSCIETRAKFVVGFPKTIEYYNRWNNKETIFLLTMMTKVELQQIIDIAPHLFEKKEEGFFYTNINKSAYLKEEVFYKGKFLCYFEKKIDLDSFMEEHPHLFKKDKMKLIRYFSSFFSITRIYYKNSFFCDLEEEILDENRIKELEKEWEDKEQEEQKKQEKESQSWSYDSNRITEESIECEGFIFKIYPSYYSPYILLTEEELFSLKSRSLSLPDKRLLSVRCKWGFEEIEANSLISLKEKIFTKREHQAWQKAKEVYHTNFTKSISVVLDWISNNQFGKIEVVPDYNFYTSDNKYGYVCLQFEQKKIRMTILKNNEEKKVANLTGEALLFLFDKHVRENYSEKLFDTKTKKGKEGYDFFMAFIKETRDEIHSDKVSEFPAMLSGLADMFVEVEQEFLNNKRV